MDKEDEGIPLAHYFKRAAWELEMIAQNPLDNRGPLDERLLEELKRGSLPEPLASAFLGVLWSEKESNVLNQSGRASKPRRDPALAAAIKTLAAREEDAKSLWPKLFAILEEEGASPTEESHQGNKNNPWLISYTSANGGQRQITFGAFQNALSKARKNKKSL